MSLGDFSSSRALQRDKVSMLERSWQRVGHDLGTKQQQKAARSSPVYPRLKDFKRDSPAGTGGWRLQAESEGSRDSAIAVLGSAPLCPSPGATGPGSAGLVRSWQSPNVGPTLDSSRALPSGAVQWFTVRLEGRLERAMRSLRP